MKRYLLILFVCLFPSVLLAQSGDGSSGNPFTGDISTSVTWSAGDFINDEVYIGTLVVPNLRVISNGHLTVEEGLTIVFVRSNSNLIVTGSGILNVIGSSSNPVLFTKHPDNLRWGHVSFETPGSGTPISGTGSFKYAIFEYGYAATAGTDPSNAGGAIQINAKDVVIDHCIFRYNYSNFGGAVTINAGTDRNTVIKNSYFHENIANQAGGAILTWTSSTPVIENCIFESNHCNGVGNLQYSGGAIWSLQNTTKIINCTFVENTSVRAGEAVYSYSSSGMRIVNSILWGSGDQFAGSSTTSTIVTCAFESAKPANASNSIIISAIASDHFVDAGNSNWTLKYISPCRDAGTNSLSGVTIPSLDYAGNSRVLATDIGAYEVQYSRWKTNAGSTDWSTASNWEASLVPGSMSDIVIPSGASPYPTGVSPVDVTVGSGKYFIMEAGARATVNNLTNGGTLRLLANSTAFSSLIATSYVRAGSGTEEIQVFLSGGGTIDDDNFKWHYISSPVASLPTNIFTGNTLDLAQFVESRPTISLRQGWVAYDGYIYSTGGMGGPTFNNLTTATNGKGYNYFHLTDHTYTFSGLLNTGAVTASLGFSNNGALSGYNLLGNPFLSGLDWNYIINDPGFPLNTTKGLYFTRDNVMCSYISGVGVPGDVTGIIPPMQGFFSKTYTTGNSIVIPVEARTHDNIHARYKGSGTIIPLVRLALAGTDLTDETVVRFDDAAKSGLDNDFDAEKFFILETKTYLYTTLGDVKYTINGLPFPETTLEIPVVANVISDGSHTINASQLQGLDNYRVSLVDQQENITTNLRVNPVYAFTASKGKIENRFVLIFSDLATNSEKVDANTSAFSIFELNSYINIIPQDDLWDGKTGTVNLVDLTGRTLRQVNGIEFRTGSPIVVSAPEQKGVYLVEIRSGLQRFTGKVLVK